MTRKSVTISHRQPLVRKVRNKYRLFRRSTEIYFIQDNSAGKQESLKARNKQEATTLLNANNEANRRPLLNLQVPDRSGRCLRSHPGQKTDLQIAIVR